MREVIQILKSQDLSEELILLELKEVLNLLPYFLFLISVPGTVIHSSPGITWFSSSQAAIFISLYRRPTEGPMTALRWENRNWWIQNSDSVSCQRLCYSKLTDFVVKRSEGTYQVDKSTPGINNRKLFWKQSYLMGVIVFMWLDWLGMFWWCSVIQERVRFWSQADLHLNPISSSF